MLICIYALMITCLRRLKWSWSWTFVHSNALTTVLECWDDWEIRGMCAWVLKCSYACMLSWSNACLFTCFFDNLLIFFFALMITHFYVHMSWCSHASMFTCFDDPMLLDHMPTYLYAFMLECLDTLMIICSYFQMLWWLQAHVHWYIHVWYPHTWIVKCL